MEGWKDEMMRGLPEASSGEIERRRAERRAAFQEHLEWLNEKWLGHGHCVTAELADGGTVKDDVVKGTARPEQPEG